MVSHWLYMGSFDFIDFSKSDFLDFFLILLYSLNRFYDTYMNLPHHLHNLYDYLFCQRGRPSCLMLRMPNFVSYLLSGGPVCLSWSMSRSSSSVAPSTGFVLPSRSWLPLWGALTPRDLLEVVLCPAHPSHGLTSFLPLLAWGSHSVVFCNDKSTCMHPLALGTSWI